MSQQIDIVANLLLKVDNAESGIKKIQSSLSKLKLPENLDNSFKKSFSNLETILARYKSQVEKGFETKGDISAFNKTSKQLDAELNKLSKHFTELTGKPVDFKVKSQEITKAEKELQGLLDKKSQLTKESLKFNIEGGKKGAQEIETLLQKLEEAAGKTKTGQYAKSVLTALQGGDLKGALSDLEKASNAYKRLGKEKQDAFKATGFDMGGALQKIIAELTNAEGKFTQFDGAIDKAKNKLANLQTDQIQKAGSYVEKLSSKMENNVSTIRQADVAMQEYARSTHSVSQQLGDLQQSTQYFFSLRNMINLLRRGIDDAVQSVKDLDAAMTQTAVVTDFTVADMWKDLPKYTKLANELGATTQGAYETMTLYYQQGLDQQAAFEIGAETMKMARIAGLDYQKTTDMMTAALRGFNMELNETSAKRVNDVYSELAAITASDTKELGTAMQRTASIAHSAGASFEGTTAFLAQAIETTREPAENIGTAMKTIVARFQEMKKNPLEISEVEGEEVDFNKIDAALKTIGVDLVDVNGQFRDFDKVMLDISAKWNTLTQSQQRYIATTAAGSRQQSRFIAMVSNYDRTMQLMEAANNSSGASEEQFGKTVESLEFKLNKLHNAWELFTMGIANNSIIKGAVDGMTKLLTGTNNLINALSLGIGPVKSFLSLLTAFIGLKAGGRIVNALIGGLGGLIDPSVGFGKGLLGGGVLGMRQQANAAQAQMIYGPIVAELRALRGEQKSIWSKQNGAYDQYNAFKNGRQQLLGLTGGLKKYNSIDVIEQLRNLTPENQTALMKTMPGTSRALRRSLLGQYENLFGTNSKEFKEIAKIEDNMRLQTKRGQVALSDYYKAMTDPKEILAQIPKDSKTTSRQVLEGLNSYITEEADKILAQKVLEDYKKNANKIKIESKEDKKAYQQALRAAQKDQAQVDAAREQALKKRGFGNTRNTKEDERYDRINKIAAGIQGAGMAITSFGNMLTSTANPALQTFGSIVTSLGGVVTNLGLGFAGLIAATQAATESTLLKTVADHFNISVGKLMAGIGLATAAIIGIATVVKKHTEKIKKEGEDVVKTYKESSEKYNNNIGNLKSWQQELPRLQAGVDKNGNNVNLSTDEYDRYREIVNGIAELNPDIVAGFNAQGDAILRTNDALDQTLLKMQELSNKATEKYLNPVSLDKLIRARNIDENWSKKVKDVYSQSEWQALDIIKTMRRNGIDDNVLKSMGYTYESLQTKAGLQSFIVNHEQAAKTITSFYEKAGAEIPKNLVKGFSELSSIVDTEEELIQPIYDELMTYAGVNKLIPDLNANLQESFNRNVKAIARSNASAQGMQRAVDKLGASYNEITKDSSEYNAIQKKITKAQEEYGKTLQADVYEQTLKGSEGTKGLIDDLQTLADKEAELANNAKTVEEQLTHSALKEFYESQIAQALDFTNKKVQDLSSAFNKLSGEMKIAAGAYESWQKKMEGIIGPEDGVQSYTQILDEIFKETDGHQYNIEGLGRPELWTGAAEILDSDWLKGKGTEQVVEGLNEVKSLLTEGEDGAQALGNKLADALTVDPQFKKDFGDIFNLENGVLSLNKGLSPEEVAKIAQSDYFKNNAPLNATALTAALNNMMQYLTVGTGVGFDPLEVRRGFSADTRMVEGQRKPQSYEGIEGKLTDLIVDQSAIVEALHGAGYYNEEQISTAINDLKEKAGVISSDFLVDVAKGAKESVKAGQEARKTLEKEYGVTADNFIKTLGPFINTADEMRELGSALYGRDFWNEDKEQEYTNLQEGLGEALTPPEIPSIESSVSNIESMLSAYLIRKGEATDLSPLDDLHKAGFGRAGAIDTPINRLHYKKGLNGKDDITEEQWASDLQEARKLKRTTDRTISDLRTALNNPSLTGDLRKEYKTKLNRAENDSRIYGNTIEEAEKYGADYGWIDPKITKEKQKDAIRKGLKKELDKQNKDFDNSDLDQYLQKHDNKNLETQLEKGYQKKKSQQAKEEKEAPIRKGLQEEINNKTNNDLKDAITEGFDNSGLSKRLNKQNNNDLETQLEKGYQKKKSQQAKEEKEAPIRKGLNDYFDKQLKKDSPFASSFATLRPALSKTGKSAAGSASQEDIDQHKTKPTTLDMTSGLGALGKTLFTSSNLIGALNKIGTSPLLNLTTSALSNVFPKDYPVGNTDLNNRQTLDWSKESKNSQNYQNALDWASPQDLQNQVSTYLSSAFTDSDKLGEYGIAFTPMLQGEDGNPQVLSSETVGTYFDQIIGQATTDGTLDFDKLMQLDQQGIETEAGRIHDLIMGTFRGEGQGLIDTTNAFGDVTHMMSDLITQGYGEAIQGLDPTAIAQNADAYNALKNVYQSVVEDSIPNEADLQVLGLDSLERTKGIGEKLKGLLESFGEADKTALAMDSFGPNNPISKAISTIVSRIQSWQQEMSNASAETVSTPTTPSATVKPEEQNKQMTISADYSQVEEAQTVITNVADIAGQGANYNINVSGVRDLNNAASNIDKINASSNEKNISIGASFNGDAVNKAIQQVKDTTAKFRVGADTGLAKSKFDSLISQISNKTVQVKVTAYYSGGTIHIPTSGGNLHTGTGAKGIKYKSLPSYGSLARGKKSRYGQVGPTDNGGLTLTGELGYEVAWIPSENRSMILGAHGPQMVDLPKDTVVWPHEQSKKILKQQSIPAGSHSTTGGLVLNNYTSGGSSGGTDNTPKVIKNTSDKVKEEAEKTADKLIKVSVWWENIARKTEASQRTMDNALKAFEKFSKQITSTLATTAASDGGGGDDYLKDIGRYQGYNEAQVSRANTELDILDKNSKKTKAQKKAETAVKKAKKTKSKNDDKKAKKALQKANYNAGAAVQISYEGKDKNGKKTTKEAIVNTSKYVKKDLKTGAYVIDQKKLNTIKDKKKRKAVADALNQEINDKESKKYKAEDNIQKAQEALEKFSEELYNNFFAWEIELTKLRDITQQIEILQSKISRKNAMESLIEAQVQSRKLSPEEGAAQTLQNFTNRLQQQQEAIVKRREAITQSTSDLRDKILGQDLAKDIEQLKANKNNATTETQKLGFDKAIEALEEQQKVVVAATQTYGRIVQNSDGTATVNFNEDAFKQAQLRGDISEEMGKAIQDFVKEVEEGSKSLDELIQAQTEGLTELYTTLNDLNDKWADYESQLIDIEEEANKKELDQIKKLSDSLKKAMDDLLAEVKRRLEERRKIEDNAKTEQDISQKQQRLAALRADTSGGNQVEIARLEKEIADAQQNYQRTLEDQLLEKLQNQADEASRQRERQIELQESIATGVNNIEEVQKWMAAPEDFKDKIWEQYKKANKYDEAVGSAGKAKIASDFATFYQGLLTNRNEQQQVLDVLDSKAIAAEEAKQKQNEGLNNQPQQEPQQEPQLEPQQEPQQESQPEPQQQPAPITWETVANAVAGMRPQDASGPALGAEAKNIAKSHAGPHKLYLSNGWDASVSSSGNVLWHDGTGTVRRYSPSTGKIEIIPYSAVSYIAEAINGNVGEEYKEALHHRKVRGYKTGGLADYTGPAWLDGTPSKPELVLNAQDTKNFIALKDVLSRAMGSINSTDNIAYGDMTYEININVEKLTSDYDVDKVAERVKKIIVKDSSYRNVTQVRNLR